MPDPAEEPKLIIDEDWKTQVQREKEELKHKLAAESAQAGSPTVAETTATDSATDSQATPEKLQPPPPASLTLLVTTLASQAMAAMGLMPGEEDEPPPTNLEFAKHFIDMLSVLEEKTKGNLNDAEKSYLQDALYQLRLAFVTVSKQKRS